MPKRIQRKRTRGWKMPENAVYVGRPTMWGNPFPVYNGDYADAVERYRRWLRDGYRELNIININCSREKRRAIITQIHTLKGKDLACWCPLDKPCHAEVLLELANEED